MPPYSRRVLNSQLAAFRKTAGRKLSPEERAAVMMNRNTLGGYRATKRKAPMRAPVRRSNTRKAPSMRKTTAPLGTGAVARPGARGPAGVGYKMQQISQTVTRVAGRAYLGAVNTSGKTLSASPNTIGLMFDVNPVLLNDRVAVVASTFDKYVYQSLRFTYVPQCPTTTSGSVALVFERDPEQDAANPQSTQFLSEVMSYENPVLTPAWQECSTSFRRDPKELKTWFIGGGGGNLSPRETSQGHMITYLSNATSSNAGYGFVVMDYVLDLVSPNIMPNLSGSLGRNLFVSQYLDDNGGARAQFTPLVGVTVSGGGPYNPSGASADVYGVPWVLGFNNAGATITNSTLNPMFVPDTTFTALFKSLKGGAVGEIVINGIDNSLLTPALVPSGLPTFDATFGYSNPGGVSLRQGSRIYWATHIVEVLSISGGQTITTPTLCLTFHQNLNTAISAAAQISTQLLTNTSTQSVVQTGLRQSAFTAGDFIGVQSDGYGNPSTTGTTFNVGGWCRMITAGSATNAQDNA